MISIDEINLLQSQNEGLKKQNKSLQREVNKFKRELQVERLRNTGLLKKLRGFDAKTGRTCNAIKY